MYLCMKIPRHTSKNPLAEGDFKWIFDRNCEGTEQLRRIYKKVLQDSFSKNIKSLQDFFMKNIKSLQDSSS